MKIEEKMPSENDENEKLRALLKHAYDLLFNVPQFPSQGPRDSHWKVQRDQFLASAEAWIGEPQ